MTQNLFNHSRLECHRDYAAKYMADSGFLLDFAGEDIAKKLKFINQNFSSILDHGARDGRLTKLLKLDKATTIATEISLDFLKQNPLPNRIQTRLEILPFAPNSFDLIISCLNLHWVNDVVGFYKRIAELLTKDGIFIANFIGAGSLGALKQLLLNMEEKTNSKHFPHISPMITSEDTYRLAQNSGFNFITVDAQNIELEYGHPLKFMRELQQMGENNNLVHSTNALSKAQYEELKNFEGSFTDLLSLVTIVASKAAPRVGSI